MNRIFSSLFFLSSVVLLSACSPNNVTIDNSLKIYFDTSHVKGTFALYDNGQGHFTVYNLSRFKDSSYTPASTFKIVNSLIGLQTGKIINENMVIKWDGIVRKHPDGRIAESWNKDLTMTQAFKISAVPYYQEVARRIGRDTMQQWLDSLKYGNHKIGNRVDSFWLDNSLKITPDEQLGLVKKLYFGQLPFSKTTMEIVKKIMVREEDANYTLALKTGWGYRENGNSIGWVVGWVEENKHPYFFVLNIEGDHNTNMQVYDHLILMGCLNHLEFFHGKK